MLCGRLYREIFVIAKQFVLFIICVFLFQASVGYAQAAQNIEKEFTVNSLTIEDKERVAKILKPLESKWVPAEELAKYPELYWQDDWQKQSFRITSNQKGLEDVYFVPIEANYEEGLNADKAWSRSISLLIINRDDLSVQVLPMHPVMDYWDAFDVSSVAFRDVRSDGMRAIIVNARGVTGAGPMGADPFDVFAVYLPANDGSWFLDSDLQKRVEHSHSLSQTLKIAKIYFNEKH